MVIEAIRFHPDIKHLRELDEYREEVEHELELARKIFRFAKRTEDTEQPTQA
jgi:hypothetical protein